MMAPKMGTPRATKKTIATPAVAAIRASGRNSRRLGLRVLPESTAYERLRITRDCSKIGGITIKINTAAITAATEKFAGKLLIAEKSVKVASGKCAW